jgi:hypothetical protein
MASNVKWYGQKVYAEVLDAMDKIINAAALDVRNEVVQSMRGPKSGRTYRVPSSKRTYTASAPGEAPAVRLGTLRQSIQVEFVAPCHRRVGTNMEYALGLELGTKRMAARPYLRPALDRVRQKYAGKVRL